MALKLKQMTMFNGPTNVDRRQKPKRRAGSGRHSNSLAAYEMEAGVISGRRAQIVAWLHGHGPATDREIAAGLFGAQADMNMVRPRLTELLDARAVMEIDRVRDAVTGMTVRRVAVTGNFECGNQEIKEGTRI